MLGFDVYLLTRHIPNCLPWIWGSDSAIQFRDLNVTAHVKKRAKMANQQWNQGTQSEQIWIRQVWLDGQENHGPNVLTKKQSKSK